jgi:hypothetical protein
MSDALLPEDVLRLGLDTQATAERRAREAARERAGQRMESPEGAVPEYGPDVNAVATGCVALR